MKDVGACDKLRVAGKQAMIRRCPNGETRRCEPPSPEREPTQGTETSKYLKERKSNETPLVVASERGICPNHVNFFDVGLRTDNNDTRMVSGSLLKEAA